MSLGFLKWILGVSATMWAAGALAQGSTYDHGLTEDKFLYNREFSAGGGLHTRGFNVSVTWGRSRNFRVTQLWQIEFLEIKHPKERRLTRDISPCLRPPRPFVYGKQNNFYAVHGGWGQRRYLSEKARRKGVAVGYQYVIGPSLGIVKPYYLDIPKPGDVRPCPDVVSIRYEEGDNAAAFLSNNIYGASGLIKGWNQVSPMPGGFFKIALIFDWGAFDEMLKAAEVGLMADVYPREVPIMINEQNRPIFFNLYLNAQIGKRRYK